MEGKASRASESKTGAPGSSEAELLRAYKLLEKKLKEAEARSSLIDNDRKVLHQEIEQLQEQNKSMQTTLVEALSVQSHVGEQKHPLGSEQKPTTFKVIVAGCSSVGKTSLAHYFAHGKANLEHGPTTGAKYSKQLWYLEKKAIQLEVCDTQGDKPGRQLLAPYCRNVDAILMVFDITNLETLQELEARFTTIIEAAHVQDPVVFILGNKVDSISGERADGFVSALHSLLQSIKTKMLEHHREGEVPPFLSYYEVSAKTGDNCREVLQQLELQIAYRKVFGKPVTKTGLDLDEDQRSQFQQKGAACCK